jgi:hypothetical protein
MKMREVMRDREASLRRAKLEASAAEGVSWGMGEDAIEEDEVIMTQYMIYIFLPSNYLYLLDPKKKKLPLFVQVFYDRIYFNLKPQVDHFYLLILGRC